jgi:hypothetical protein
VARSPRGVYETRRIDAGRNDPVHRRDRRRQCPGRPRVIANATGSIGLCKLGRSHQGGQGWYAVRLVKFNGMEHVMENVINKAYPLFHLLYLISKGEPTGAAVCCSISFGRQIIRQGKTMCRWNRERWYWTGAVGLGFVPILAIFRLAIFLFWNAADAWSQLGFRELAATQCAPLQRRYRVGLLPRRHFGRHVAGVVPRRAGGVLRGGLSRPALGGKSARGDEREITTMIERKAHFSFAILPGDQSAQGRAGDPSAHREPPFF